MKRLNFTLHETDPALIRHWLVLSEILADARDDDLDLDALEDDAVVLEGRNGEHIEFRGDADVFDALDYFRMLSYVLEQMDFKITVNDPDMNHQDRGPQGDAERTQCWRVLQAIRAVLKEIDVYQKAGYAPKPVVIGLTGRKSGVETEKDN